MRELFCGLITVSIIYAIFFSQEIQVLGIYKMLSCRREAAGCSVLLKILLSYSRLCVNYTVE